MRALTLFIALILALALSLAGQAQEEEQPPQAAPVVDSSRALDTLTLDTAAIQDSLTDAERARKFFEERVQKMHVQAALDTIPPNRFSPRDSLRAWFLPERWNLRRLADQTFINTPADYLKFVPSMVTFDYYPSPFRATAQPFGLPGNRLGVVENGLVFRPFEHLPEPDGQIDLYDLPLALDYDIYAVPGPIGRLFGGDGLMTMITEPVTLTTTAPASSIFVDKGLPGFSQTRGQFSKRFRDGRIMRFGIGYRTGDPIDFGVGEDAYNYDAFVSWLVGRKFTVRTQGHVYDRAGTYRIRPDRDPFSDFARDRFDRQLETALTYRPDSLGPVWELGYRHQRNSSYLNGGLKGRHDLTGNAVFLRRAWHSMFGLTQANIDLNFDEYDGGAGPQERTTGSAGLSTAHSSGSNSYAAFASGRYFDESFYVGSVGGVWMRETERSLASVSMSFTTRHPSLYEQHVPFARSIGYGGLETYSEQGNPFLTAEEELAGHVSLALGVPERALTLQVSGGRLGDGIRWAGTYDIRVVNAAEFQPVNQDIDFVTATVTKQGRFSNWLNWHAGAAYYYLSEDYLYTPDHRAFGGLEAHYFWKSRQVHLYGYLEPSWVGKYSGPFDPMLGENFVINARLSLQMGRFRIYYLAQNLLSYEYEVREDLLQLGRRVSWGIIWHFVD